MVCEVDSWIVAVTGRWWLNAKSTDLKNPFLKITYEPKSKGGFQNQHFHPKKKHEIQKVRKFVTERIC